MRNFYRPSIEGEPIVGKILYGKKYEFGSVTEEEFDDAMNSFTQALNNANGAISRLTSDNFRLQTEINALAAKVEMVKQIASFKQPGPPIFFPCPPPGNQGGSSGSETETDTTVAPSITAFNASPASSAMGSTASIILSWTISGNATTVTIDGVEVTGNSKTVTATADHTYSLVATNVKGSDTKTASISFKNYRYWGTGSTFDIASMTKELSSSKSKSFSVDCGSAEKYVFYAIPKRLGTCTFKMFGFSGGMNAAIEQNITNAEGYTEPYYVYKSEYALTGIVDVDAI